MAQFTRPRRYTVRGDRLHRISRKISSAEDLRTTAPSLSAFPLQTGSKDAALIISLVPGNYTIQVRGVANTTGVALVEAYDVPNN